MKGLRTTLAMVLAVTALTSAVAARDRAELPAPDDLPGAADWPAIDSSLLDHYRVHSNGLVEYGFAPPDWMSPPPSTLPRPSYVTASMFVSRNLETLGIQQAASDFRYLSSERRCDGSEVVTFFQTTSYIPVEGSFLRLRVQGGVVRYVDASFIANPKTLPLCQPSGAGELRYVPQTERTIVIAIEIEQVWDGRQLERYRDACSGQMLGYTLRTR